MRIGSLISSWRSERKLEKAIVNGDLELAKAAIDRGARAVDYVESHPGAERAAGVALSTKDPLQLAEWKGWKEDDRQELARALGHSKSLKP